MTRIVTPLINDKEEYFDYGVCETTGAVYSKKRGREWRMLKPNISGNCDYPRVSLSNYGNNKKVLIHRVVAQTLFPSPIPKGVTKNEWRVTPNSIKRIVEKHMQVNHIDHNVLNFKPDNLEWVTGSENIEKYQDHRTSSNATMAMKIGSEAEDITRFM